MKNPNALIAMAQVAQNASNPYTAFCEYIKYCIFANVEEKITITELRTAVGNEFGLYMPHNVLLKCLSYIEEEGLVSFDDHQIRRKGSYDTESFDQSREEYRNTEFAIIQALIQYVSVYKREWSVDYARELLIKILDRNGLAYDIFLHKKNQNSEDTHPEAADSLLSESFPDDDELEAEENDNQPLFTDEYFVGNFIEKVIAENTRQKEYLQKICEGLMLCVGTYQLPTSDQSAVFPQISGTSFFFDTKLLLRFIGCAGKAAVEATRELVSMIQDAGGNIYYYPQTKEEMEHAFDKAVYCLTNGDTPRDDEMRLYTASIKNNVAILTGKKANLTDELASKQIFVKPHETFNETERICFGFDYDDFQQYMQTNLNWDPRVISNDARAIWETHMRRRGNYNEYCGTNAQLPVFVTTNTKLIDIALKYHEVRKSTTAISGWHPNRLPVITDVRLTCRLWSPATQSERISLLYLSANAVAAKRPTARYLNAVRELAIKLEEQVPEYSGICLPAYFDDNVTEAVLAHTLGVADNLNINSFASSIAELSEWKAKEQEEITNQVISERNDISNELENQTKAIIDGAVESGQKLLGWRKVTLWLVVNWPIIVPIIFSGIMGGVSLSVGSWHPMWAVLLPIIVSILEKYTASRPISKRIARRLLPKIEASINSRITNNLRKAELPYSESIIQQIKEQTDLWVKCKNISD